MKNERIYEFIQKEISSSPYLDKAISNLRELLTNEKEIDYERFVEWWRANNISFKGNPPAYLNKKFPEALSSGQFDQPPYAYQPLFNTMREKKITMVGYDSLYISVMFDYILNNKLLTLDEVVSANRIALAELEGKGKTSGDFITLWRKSKLCKDKVDWEELKEIAKEEKEKWKKLIMLFD